MTNSNFLSGIAVVFMVFAFLVAQVTESDGARVLMLIYTSWTAAIAGLVCETVEKAEERADRRRDD